MRVGAALKAVSMVAGASVLRPYLLFSASIAASSRARLCSSSSAVEEVERVQAVGDQPAQMHADEVRMVEFAPAGRMAQSGSARQSASDCPGTRSA